MKIMFFMIPGKYPTRAFFRKWFMIDFIHDMIDEINKISRILIVDFAYVKYK